MLNMYMECFEAAVETLNFTEAAKKIHITQPAFSRNIAALEDDLGFKLFWRSKKEGLRVTPAGLALYNGIKDIDESYKKIIDRAQRINRGEEGQLIIGLNQSSCMDRNTHEIIRKFRNEFPSVSVVLRSHSFSELTDSVIEGTTDIIFAMTGTILQGNALLSEPIYKVHSYLVVPADLGYDPNKIYHISDFKDQCIILSEDSPQINEMFVGLCRENGFEPRTKMAPDYETKLLWTEAGEGISGCSRDHYLQYSDYVTFLRVHEMEDMYYSMVWNKENYNPAIALFYSALDEQVTMEASCRGMSL
ncbi:MAG: LysR family transcriptional regulator [Parasporobacterium sp.]|nr:LysR family transcriptional regulator [Parasporobacterium sp.]